MSEKYPKQLVDDGSKTFTIVSDGSGIATKAPFSPEQEQRIRELIREELVKAGLIAVGFKTGLHR